MAHLRKLPTPPNPERRSLADKLTILGLVTAVPLALGSGLLTPELRKCIGLESGKCFVEKAVVIESEVGAEAQLERLKTLLEAKKFREADKETEELMLWAVKRNQENWFSLSSISTFPCTDLRTINLLWTHYSQGRFGFGIQKQIWRAVGENYGNFTVSVGWDNDYNKFSFDQREAKGHLPAYVYLFSDPKSQLVSVVPSVMSTQTKLSSISNPSDLSRDYSLFGEFSKRFDSCKI